MEERIKSIYNECWKIYKQYLETRDMAEWNRNMLQVKEKYGGKPDVVKPASVAQYKCAGAA